MADLVKVAATLLAFAVLVTVHVAIVVGLARRPGRWRAVLALLVPPFAPAWAWRTHMRARSLTWLGATVAYGAMLLLDCR